MPAALEKRRRPKIDCTNYQRVCSCKNVHATGIAGCTKGCETHRFRCPICDKCYRYKSWMNNHLNHAHKALTKLYLEQL